VEYQCIQSILQCDFSAHFTNKGLFFTYMERIPWDRTFSGLPRNRLKQGEQSLVGSHAETLGADWQEGQGNECVSHFGSAIDSE
jgi:hypothetical protein